MKKSKNLESGRLESIDALRGFDMFWITGGQSMIVIPAKLTGFALLTGLSKQFHHAAWEGFNFFDLIFPLFMFISGTVIPFAITSKLEKGVGKKTLLVKSLKRMVILVFLGFIYNKVLAEGFIDGRYPSVLGQIGIAYFFTALVVILSPNLKIRLYILVAIFIFVTILQLFIPVPGFGPAVLTPDGCINGYIDRLILPGRLYTRAFDPEGLLCIISATSITLLGTFAGFLLRVKKYNDWIKVLVLFLSGAILIAMAIVLNPVYPIIKKCWTVTFVLLSGGISSILLALFYMIIDVLKIRKWAFFFRIIGMNSIFIYLLRRFVDVKKISNEILGWTNQGFGDWYPFIEMLGSIIICWFLLYYMYKRNIFLKV